MFNDCSGINGSNRRSLRRARHIVFSCSLPRRSHSSVNRVWLFFFRLHGRVERTFTMLGSKIIARGRLRPYRILATRLSRPLCHPSGFISCSSSTGEFAVPMSSYQRHSLPATQSRRQSTFAVFDEAQSDMDVVSPWTVVQNLSKQTGLSESSDLRVDTGSMDILKAPNNMPATLPQSFPYSQALTNAASDKEEKHLFWTDVPLWSDVGADDFISQYWQVS